MAQSSHAPDPSFDPYYSWLGIPPAKQPPNHYQLLGLADLESNLNVIATAADRQTAHLRSFLDGQHSFDAERLLAEVEAVRSCLLNEHTKSAYDGVLGIVTPSRLLSPIDTVPTTHRSVPVLQPAKAVLTDAAPSSSLVDCTVDASTHTTVADQPNAVVHRRRRAKPQRSPVVQVVQIVVGGIAGCALGYYLGFVLLPAIRARKAAPRPQPSTELIIRQSSRPASQHTPPRQFPPAATGSSR
ncbi:MAG: hypothetical protein H6823_18800 [Planctomycetaceae bacterium]|nr:hypothetical protein [Planctomycetales bacterium]MCB9940292.1 hypothetical protein [Planctomycetaceae bacterium]